MNACGIHSHHVTPPRFHSPSCTGGARWVLPAHAYADREGHRQQGWPVDTPTRWLDGHGGRASVDQKNARPKPGNQEARPHGGKGGSGINAARRPTIPERATVDKKKPGRSRARVCGRLTGERRLRDCHTTRREHHSRASRKPTCIKRVQETRASVDSAQQMRASGRQIHA